MLGFGSKQEEPLPSHGPNPSHRQGTELAQKGNWAAAEQHFRQALSEVASPLFRVRILMELQECLRRQNRLPEAIFTANHAVEGARALRDRRLTTESLEVLAALQMEANEPAAAVELLSQAANSANGHSLADLARKSRILRKQGIALLRCGRPAEAQELLQRALSLAEKAFGHAHVETAHALSDIGALHSETGNHAIAQNILRDALELYREVAGPDSPEASNGLHNLAMSLEAAGQLDQATSEYERILAERERQLGTSRELTAEMKARLALLYVNAGKIAPARELLQHAIGVLERSGSPAYILALETLALADEISGRHADAQLWRQKLARMQPAVA